MKKLFVLKDQSTGKAIPDLFFDNKMLAKERRKEMNPRSETGVELFKFVVTKGPDHDRK